MTSELVPWRGHNVPVIQPEISRYSLTDLFARMTQNWGNLQSVTGVTYTQGKKAAEPIANNFEGYVEGMLYRDGPVAAVQWKRVEVFSQAAMLYQKLEDGQFNQLYDDPRLDLLRTPWVGGSTASLMTRALLYNDLGGNAYIVEVDDELVVLRPDWVEIILEARMRNGKQVGWKKVGYAYTEGGLGNGDPAYLLVDEVAHFASDPDPLASYRGMSWMTPIVREVMADKLAMEHKTAFFENAASPNLAVSLPKELTKDQFLAFVDAMNDKHSGVQNAGKTLYTGGGADVTVIGANMQQMDFAAVQGKGETRIANAGRVPAVVVGFSEGMQGSSLNAGNYQAAKRSFADTTCQYLWAAWCPALSVLFPPPNPGDRLWYNPRAISYLSEDAQDVAAIQQTQASTMSSLITSGYEPDSAVQFVVADDPTKLKHSGLTSVQLLPPGARDTDGDGSVDETAADDEAEADYQSALQAARSWFDLADSIARARYNIRNPEGSVGGGRFRKLSAVIIQALEGWMNGEGDEDDPLEKFEPPQLRQAAKQLGLVKDRERVSKPELKKRLLAKATADVRAQKDGGDAPEPAEDKPDPKAREAEVENRIRAAYADLPAAPGGYVGLADLRERLSDLSSREVDEALVRLSRDPNVRVTPVANLKSLTGRDRAASVRIGEDDANMIAFLDVFSVTDRAQAELILKNADPGHFERGINSESTTRPQLVKAAKLLGLPATGTSAQLRERLVGRAAELRDAPDPSAPRAGGVFSTDPKIRAAAIAEIDRLEGIRKANQARLDLANPPGEGETKAHHVAADSLDGRDPRGSSARPDKPMWAPPTAAKKTTSRKLSGSQFKQELKPGDEVSLNSEKGIVKSVSDEGVLYLEDGRRVAPWSDTEVTKLGASPSPAVAKVAKAKAAPAGPNVKTKAGRNAYLADLIDEELAADNPALDDNLGGITASPRELLTDMRDRLRAGDATTDFDNSFSFLHAHMATRFGQGAEKRQGDEAGKGVTDAFNRIDGKYRAVAPVRGPKTDRRFRAPGTPLSADTPASKRPPVPERVKVELSLDARRVLDSMSGQRHPPSREQAAEMLKGLSTPDLRAIGKDLSIPGAGSMSLVKLRKEIVEATAGRRLDSISIRGYDELESPMLPREVMNLGGGARPKADSPDRARQADEAFAELKRLEGERARRSADGNPMTPEEVGDIQVLINRQRAKAAALRSRDLASQPPSEDKRVAAEQREARLNVRREMAEALIELDEMRENGSSAKAAEFKLRARGRKTALPPDLVEEMIEASTSGDRARIDALIDRLAAENNLIRITGPAGSVEPFDRKRHDPVGEPIQPGQPVFIMRPGYSAIDLTYQFGGGDGPLVIEKAKVQAR